MIFPATQLTCMFCAMLNRGRYRDMENDKTVKGDVQTVIALNALRVLCIVSIETLGGDLTLILLEAGTLIRVYQYFAIDPFSRATETRPKTQYFTIEDMCKVKHRKF